jgi:hypothetical protein
MKRLILIVAGVALGGLILGVGCGDDDDGQEPKAAVPLRTIAPEQLLHLTATRDRPLRLRRERDALPGGLAAAMAPMLIDWKASEIGRSDGFVVVRNLNCGGNPLAGTTVLQRVRIPLDGVERIEWTLVPLKGGGGRGQLHHGQLRFVFREDRPAELLDLVPPSGGGDRELHDLVASWEAWREPGVGYDVKAGMDPDAYRLALRLYAGPQRFLADALGDRDWYCTPLRLPGGPEGLAEVLKVTLALGDGVARHTLSEEFAEAGADWLAGTPASRREDVAATWRTLLAHAEPRRATDDSRINLPPEQRGYQSVLRSCATVAYYSVLVAVNRLLERGLDDGVQPDKLDDVHLGGDEPWMREVAHADLGGLFARAPSALRWLRAHPHAVPGDIPERLERAGLVDRVPGEEREVRYSASGVNPYR